MSAKHVKDCVCDDKGKDPDCYKSGPDALEQERDQLKATNAEFLEALVLAKNALENTVAQAGLCAHHITDERRARWLRSEVENEANIGFRAISAAMAKARGES